MGDEPLKPSVRALSTPSPLLVRAVREGRCPVRLRQSDDSDGLRQRGGWGLVVQDRWGETLAYMRETLMLRLVACWLGIMGGTGLLIGLIILIRPERSDD